MQFFEAFDKTLSQFSIKNRELQQSTGISDASISRFRRGERDLHTATLQTLIAALPPEAQQHYYLGCLVAELDDSAMAVLLNAIALKLRTGAQAKPYEDEKVPA
jgi:DNA-binding Xre family transcriptional regulator